MKRFAFIAALMCSILTPAGSAAAAEPEAASAPSKFVGGPYDGMRFSHEVRADRSFRTSLFPSKENASPLKGAKVALISAFLKAYYAEDWAALLRLTAPGARSWIVDRDRFPNVGGPYLDSDRAMDSFDKFPFVERCVSRTPYDMRDGWVRLEWMCEDKLWYISWLQIAEGRVTWMETRRARAPLVVDAETLARSSKAGASEQVDR